jgi:hypothetical protein
VKIVVTVLIAVAMLFAVSGVIAITTAHHNQPLQHADIIHVAREDKYYFVVAMNTGSKGRMYASPCFPKTDCPIKHWEKEELETMQYEIIHPDDSGYAAAQQEIHLQK